MADSNFAAVTGALEQYIRQAVEKQYNRSIVTSNLIRKVPGMGKNLAWDVSIGTATGQVFDDGQIVSTFNADTETLATLAWAEYGDAFKITGLAEDAAQFSRTQLGDLWTFKAMQARERAGFLVNNDFWTGAGTTAPQRLFGVTMAANGPLGATGTYAGINRATFPQWAGITMLNGGVQRAVSLSLIEYGLELVFNASGKTPTYGLTTANIWRLLCELAGGERRTNQDVYIRGQKLNIGLGFNSVEVNGIPIFKDISVPTGYLGFFSEDCIEFEYLPTNPARIARGKILAQMPLAGLPQEQDYTRMPAGGSMPLMANVLALPSGGNFESWQIDVALQLKVKRPNANLLIGDIAFRAE